LKRAINKGCDIATVIYNSYQFSVFSRQFSVFSDQMRIVIAGAGPAGAMAAIRLARAGADVSLLDPSHPREKPCGGGLTGRALDLVYDVIDIGSLPAVVVRSARVEPPDGDKPSADVPLIDRGATPASSLIVLSRSVFDRALVDAAIAAGAKLLAEKVSDVSIGRNGRATVVHTDRGEHRADFVLGADGATSVVRKKLSIPFSRAQLSVAAGFFVHGTTSHAIDIKSMTEQPGYLWSFPRPDHLAVGICAPAAERSTSGDLRQQSLEWIRSHRLDRGTRLDAYAWPIPTIGVGTRAQTRAAGEGWMLLGDAAGLVDPLTREGIYYALLSGVWAAEALTCRSPSEAPQAYQDRIDAEIRPELVRAAMLSRMFFTRAFSSLFVEALGQSDAIRRVFADLVGGTQPYRGLRRRLLATRQWKLAGRAIQLGIMPVFAGTMRGETSPRSSSTA
jgi:geranylgeranyl reductase family protein